MNVANNRIIFDDVSKFYGEVLGVNRVNLSLPRALPVWLDRMVRARPR